MGTLEELKSVLNKNTVKNGLVLIFDVIINTKKTGL